MEQESVVLVLQGGGAMGAYQAGAFEALSRNGQRPDWVAGISIGAINAALICGNPPERSVTQLRMFWERVTTGNGATAFWNLMPTQWMAEQAPLRKVYEETMSATVVADGIPSFFTPRLWPEFWPFRQDPPLSFYDTAPLRDTLMELVDFDYLNRAGPRLSVGAVDIETADFVYFDSQTTRITPEHIMASGALPPGFPPVEIDGRFYWDGGLVSNIPLHFVMEHIDAAQTCIFQVDVFSARGDLPEDLAEVAQRQKDIQYSSRTRLNTDRYRSLHALRAAAERLAEKLPPEWREDPDLAQLTAATQAGSITLAHLIHRKQSFETQVKDYDFSCLSMQAHWAAGGADVETTMTHPSWQAREVGRAGLQVFDLTAHAPESPD